MIGKTVKVSSNDLYGNTDNRSVMIYACFVHNKYANNYVIFKIINNDQKINSNELCYGSIHVKDDSLVIFSVKNDIKQYIDEFVNEYINNNVTEYGLLDVSKVKKVELISYNTCQCDKLNILEKMSIKPVENNIDNSNKKKKSSVFLYVLLFIFIIVLGGATYLYFNPNALIETNKELNCKLDLFNNDIKVNYVKNIDIKFDKEDKIDNIMVNEIYHFNDIDSYNDFKDNSKHTKYFNKIDSYEYIDSSMEMKIVYKENFIIDNYDEMKVYLNNNGYSCIEGSYEKKFVFNY